MSRFQVRKVAVLGAGVMGAQIAAHLVNVKVPVVLFDLPAKEGPKNGIVTKAVEGLKKLKPAPLGVAENAALIQQANYEEHLELLKDCDLIIEAIAERMDWKLDLYTKIAPFVAPHAIVASNTSGLSITKLSEVLPESIKPRFCGIHFFNPPRYMYLVELINTPTTNPEVIDQLESFVTSAVGKGVVRANDTPNFVANRVGIAGMMATMIEAEKFGLSVDVVDDLTGKKLGRASSGTFRTADVVGLDTMAHVVKTMQDNLKDDPFYSTYATPKVLAGLIEKGALGQKAGAGFYKKVGKDIQRLDFATGEYVAGGGKADEIVARMLKKQPADRIKLLKESSNPQAQFLWSILRDSFQYVAVHLDTVADTAREIDFAMRWGFGSQQGPFELWQAAGWKQVAEWIADDIVKGATMSSAPLPDWVFDGREGVHGTAGSFSPARKAMVPRSANPVYARQRFPELRHRIRELIDVLGHRAPKAIRRSRARFEPGPLAAMGGGHGICPHVVVNGCQASMGIDVIGLPGKHKLEGAFRVRDQAKFKKTAPAPRHGVEMQRIRFRHRGKQLESGGDVAGAKEYLSSEQQGVVLVAAPFQGVQPVPGVVGDAGLERGLTALQQIIRPRNGIPAP